MRFRQRSSVDFPHPDGPMMAVTAWAEIDIDTSLTAGLSPKNADKCLVTMQGCCCPTPTAGVSADAARGIGKGTRA